jgi:hypothetical protein
MVTVLRWTLEVARCEVVAKLDVAWDSLQRRQRRHEERQGEILDEGENETRGPSARAVSELRMVFE